MNRSLPISDSPPPSSDYAPSVASTAASQSGRNQRSEQIVQASPKKVNKWFNLELEDHKTYKTELKYWRTACLSTPSPSPMILEIYLDAADLNHRQILVLNDELLQKVKVDVGNGSLSTHLKYIDKISKKQTILLESWQLFLIEPINLSVVDLPVVYKKSIVFFRSLYTYVRQLPAYRLFRRLRKMKLKGLKLGYRLTTAPTSPENEIGIDTPISEADSNGGTSNHAFDPIDTPLGSFVLNVRYRSNCDFCVEDPEAVLSSKFNTTDKEAFLTASPTEMDSQLQEHSDSSRYHGSLESRSYRMSHTSSLRSSHGSSRPKSMAVNTAEDYPRPFLASTPRTGSSLSIADCDGHRFSQPSYQRASPSFSSVGSRQYIRARSLSSTSGKLPIDIDENENSNADNRIDIYGTAPLTSSRRSVWNQNSSVYSRSPRPSLSLISPFKSPSLSTSPASVHETSSSSLLGLRRKTSTTSLHQQYANSSTPRTAAIPLPLGKAPTGATKLSSSFGNRYNSDTSREDSRSSQGLPRRHRTTSLLSNDGLYDAGGRSSRPQSRASVITNQPDDDDVGEFVKLIDARGSLKMFDAFDTSENSAGGGQGESAFQHSLSRFHQLKQENSMLSDSLMAASTVFTSEAGRSHSDASASNQISGSFDGSSREILGRSSDTLRYPNPRADQVPLYSRSLPNSFVAESGRAFEALQAPSLKHSKSMITMRRSFSDTEYDSEIESEESKPMHTASSYRKSYLHGTNTYTW
ncbi:hypothetical protein K493DRAFT_339120 [Basidiobolus meristosporus CBS 931.73]|uniref:Autophagy-related protein 13 n=1 Tax=Basidiobolus meristosporus CBS 931.73 TaxID=1314790 RepID=A0A1Y1Y1E8_9FUNG|nr:hypothetical protein K493DRAFT_339120 [Basidiobolus meristosporus CBS 931.73]|eukprot:ORX91841.1 hypothetical protein K493DRAFT_339120 [Basidiobolus meristosporus CBS 931.73]